MNRTLSSSSESWIVQTWTGSPETGHAAPCRDAAGESALLQAEFVIRTLAGLYGCASAGDASRLVANRLHQFLGCRQVAVGLCSGRRRRCRIHGLSGVVRFDSHSAFMRAVQDALEETLVRGQVTTWPPRDGAEKHGSLAHERLVSMLGADHVVSIPLQQDDGQFIGVVLLIDEPAGGILDLMRRHGSALASGLAFLERNQRSYLARQLHRLRSACFTWRGRAACLAAVAGGMLLAVPWPYRIQCECQIQPVTRRFIAAPYDGTLDKTLVSPGDVVRKGDILARMDQREIRWELAGLEADMARARKERDAAMAVHHASRTQLVELEIERLQLQIQLLDHRARNLDIKSPLDGIVVAGDLEKAEGAPLVIGQTLFEVAPLDRMYPVPLSQRICGQLNARQYSAAYILSANRNSAKCRGCSKVYKQNRTAVYVKPVGCIYYPVGSQFARLIDFYLKPGIHFICNLKRRYAVDLPDSVSHYRGKSRNNT